MKKFASLKILCVIGLAGFAFVPPGFAIIKGATAEVEFDSMRGFEDAAYENNGDENGTFGLGDMPGHSFERERNLDDDLKDLEAEEKKVMDEFDKNFDKRTRMYDMFPVDEEAEHDRNLDPFEGQPRPGHAPSPEAAHAENLSKMLEKERQHNAERKEKEAKKLKVHSIRKDVQGVTPLS